MSTDIFNYFSMFVALFFVCWSGIAFCSNLRGWQSKNHNLSRKSGQFARFAGLEMHFALICEAGRAKIRKLPSKSKDFACFARQKSLFCKICMDDGAKMKNCLAKAPFGPVLLGWNYM